MTQVLICVLVHVIHYMALKIWQQFTQYMKILYLPEYEMFFPNSPEKWREGAEGGPQYAGLSYIQVNMYLYQASIL